MEITQLRYFITLANTLNFSETARIHAVPQPTISRSIMDLEHKLEVPLFTRTKREVQLTREGRTLLPFAQDVVKTWERASFLVRQVSMGCPGTVSIAALPTSGYSLMRLLEEFSRRYPEVMIDIAQNTGLEQNRALMNNRFDFHFLQSNMLPEGEQMEHMVTHRDETVMLVPKGHPLASKPLDFYQLNFQRIIMLSEEQSPQLYRQVVQMFARHGLTPRVAQRYDKAETIVLSVTAGLGISFLPRGLVQAFNPSGVEMISLPGENLELTYVMAWPKLQNNPSARLFLEVARECFGQENAAPGGEAAEPTRE